MLSILFYRKLINIYCKPTLIYTCIFSMSYEIPRKFPRNGWEVQDNRGVFFIYYSALRTHENSSKTHHRREDNILSLSLLIFITSSLMWFVLVSLLSHKYENIIYAKFAWSSIVLTYLTSNRNIFNNNCI